MLTDADFDGKSKEQVGTTAGFNGVRLDRLMMPLQFQDRPPEVGHSAACTPNPEEWENADWPGRQSHHAHFGCSQARSDARSASAEWSVSTTTRAFTTDKESTLMDNIACRADQEQSL